MSYVRWSTLLGTDYSAATGVADPVAAMSAYYGGMTPSEQAAALERQNAVQSDWYIYWDTASDDSLGRNGQLLAVWHAGQPPSTPSLDYQELRRIADQGRWELIPGYDPDEHPLNVRCVQDCVRRWLAEMEKEFPPVPAQSRRELAAAGLERVRAALAEYVTQDDRDRIPVALHHAARIRDIADRAVAAADPETESIAAASRAALAAANSAAAAVGMLPVPDAAPAAA